jgi:hypothetical protein
LVGWDAWSFGIGERSLLSYPRLQVINYIFSRSIQSRVFECLRGFLLTSIRRKQDESHSIAPTRRLGNEGISVVILLDAFDIFRSKDHSKSRYSPSGTL